MQACAESPVTFLNEMLESINASVQELKHSELLRLPLARPLRVGVDCHGLLHEERLSVFWNWPGLEKTAFQVMDNKAGDLLVGSHDIAACVDGTGTIGVGCGRK